MNDLITSNMGLAHYAANRFSNTGIEYDDLVSIAYIGLVKAAKAFTVEKGCKFATFAMRCIDNEILMTIRNSKKSCKAVSHLHDLVHENITIEDLLSTDCDFTEIHVTEFLATLKGRDLRIIEERISTEKTLTEIGISFDISQSRVSRILRSIGNRLIENVVS